MALRLRELAALFVFAAGVRLAFSVPGLLWTERALTNDSYEYIQPAVNLVEGNGFSWDRQPPYRPNIFITPGYPLLIVPAVLAGDAVRGPVLLNVLLGSFTAVIVALLGLLLFGPRAGLAAGALFGLNLNSLIWGTTVMSDTAFVLLFTLFALLLFIWRQERRLPTLLTAGVVLGLATTVRPIGLVLLPVLFLFVIIAERRRLWRGCLMGLAAVAVPILVVLPWTARNYFTVGYAGYNSIPEVNSLLCSSASVVAQLEGVPIDTVRKRLITDLSGRHGWGLDSTSYYEYVNRPECLSVLRQEALDTVLAHPCLYLALNSLGVAKSLLHVGPADVGRLFGHSVSFGTFPDKLAGLPPGAKLLWWVWLVQLAALYLLGVAALVRSSNRPAVGLLLLLGAPLLLSVGTGGYSRFRAPVEPLLSVVAAAGLMLIVQWSKKRG